MSRGECTGHMSPLLVLVCLVVVAAVVIADAAKRPSREVQSLGRRLPRRAEQDGGHRTERHSASVEPHRHRHRPHARHRGTTAGPGGEGSLATSAAPEVVSSAPAACYGPDRVVLIIAITCALNFACVFLVMALVHVCNRKCPSNGYDSPLLLTGSDGDPEDAKAADEDGDVDEEALLLLCKRRQSFPEPSLLLSPAFSMENLHILEGPSLRDSLNAGQV